MHIICLSPLAPGVYNDHKADHITTPPDGWAMIPEGLAIPDTFPWLGSIEAEEVTYYNEVEVPATREVPVLDDEGNPVLDEEGNPLTAMEDYADKKQVPIIHMTVTAMTPGIVPEPEPEPEPEPTLDERNRADIDYIALMTGIEL